MRSRWLILLAILTLLSSSMLAVSPTTQQGAQAAARPKVGARGAVTHGAITGYLITAPATTTVPVNLSIQTPHNGIVTVTVSSSTRIVRRYNGPSALDELSTNDILQVTGWISGSHTISASFVRDTSIQVAYTRTLGKVTAVTPNSVLIVVQKDLYKLSPMSIGQNITLPVGASTQVISGSTIMTGTTSPITIGARIISLGVYNRNSNTFQSTWRIRLLTPKVTTPPPPFTPVPATGTAVLATSTPVPATATPVTTTTAIPATATITPTATSTTTTSIPGARSIGGPIVSAPADDEGPTTLTVQDLHFGLVTVNVPAGINVYRRYGALTQLDELNINDNLHISGYFTSATTFTATSIQDYSIEDLSARFVGQIVSVNGSTVTATAAADRFTTATGLPVGAIVTLTVSANTKYLIPNPSTAHGVIGGSVSNLAPNQTITVRGVYDRKSRTFIVVSLVRVHR